MKSVVRILFAFSLLATAYASIGGKITPLHPTNQMPASLAEHALLVVHATTEDPESVQAINGIDKLIAEFKKAQRPVIFLRDDITAAGDAAWITKDRSPDYDLFSEGGEHNLPLVANEVTIVGGYFGSYDGSRGCQTLAMRDAARMHFEKSKTALTIHMPVPALYFYEGDQTTRRQLLKFRVSRDLLKNWKTTFPDFPTKFFLTDTFPPSTQFSHPYVGDMNRHYRKGTPTTLSNYSFELFFMGNSLNDKFGSGPRKVVLDFQN
jgi:hypothetical protein